MWFGAVLFRGLCFFFLFCSFVLFTFLFWAHTLVGTHCRWAADDVIVCSLHPSRSPGGALANRMGAGGQESAKGQEDKPPRVHNSQSDTRSARPRSLLAQLESPAQQACWPQRTPLHSADFLGSVVCRVRRVGRAAWFLVFLVVPGVVVVATASVGHALRLAPTGILLSQRPKCLPQQIKDSATDSCLIRKCHSFIKVFDLHAEHVVFGDLMCSRSSTFGSYVPTSTTLQGPTSRRKAGGLPIRRNRV